MSRKITIALAISLLFSHAAEAQQAPARQQPSDQSNANRGMQPANPQATIGLPKQGTQKGTQQAAATQATASQQSSASSVANAAGSEIPWLRSATEAAIQSQNTGKPILVYIRSKNCHYCDLLQQNTWQDPATKARVMKEMIPLKLTLEENKEAIEAMKVKGFPSVIVFSPRREFIGRFDGYMTPEQFQSQISKTLLANQPQNNGSLQR
jgi:thioredoxin-related protein